MRFAYNKLAYFGKYGLSMKAINIDFVELKPNPPQPVAVPQVGP
jgi:hypothetical protein